MGPYGLETFLPVFYRVFLSLEPFYTIKYGGPYGLEAFLPVFYCVKRSQSAILYAKIRWSLWAGGVLARVFSCKTLPGTHKTR